MGIGRYLAWRRERTVNWLVSRDERFYRSFLLGMLAFFAVLTYFWMLAAGALVATGMWWIFYETIVVKRSL